MSHFVTIRTELRELDHVRNALREMGLGFEEGQGLTVHGDQRRVERAEVVIRGTPGADIGLRRAGETYEVVADWYRVEASTALRRGAFVADLAREYARSVIRDQAREQNLIVEEERLEEGEIVITLSERE